MDSPLIKNKIRISAIIFCFILFFICSDISSVSAKEGIDKNTGSKINIHAYSVSGIHLDASIFTAFNQSGIVGAGSQFDLFYRLPIKQKDGPLFKSAKIEYGLQEFITPAFNRISFIFKIEPIAFFDIKTRIGYDYIFKFYTLDSPRSEYDTDTRDKAPHGSLHSQSGFRSDVTPTFKYKAGNFVTLYSFTWTYHNYGYDRYYYDYNTYIPHKGEDSFFCHDVKVLYLFNNVRIGPQLTCAFVHSSGKERMKLSLLLAYMPRWSFFDIQTQPFLGISYGYFIKEEYNQYKPEVAICIGINRPVY